MNGALGFLAELLFPRRARCIGCGSIFGQERDDLCEACRKKLELSRVGVFQTPADLRLSAAICVYSYAGVGGSLVRALKYNSTKILARQMGEEIAQACLKNLPDRMDYICFVPMQPDRERRRGFNQGELIARAAAESLGVSCEPLLLRLHRTRRQVTLSDAQRRNNLKDAFGVKDGYDLRGKSVLLIDDVFTTGSTAKYCAKALRMAGAKQIYFAAFAKGRNRS